MELIELIQAVPKELAVIILVSSGNITTEELFAEVPDDVRELVFEYCEMWDKKNQELSDQKGVNMGDIISKVLMFI